ncbi:MAG: efflux RND transporter periplasmic adaptor subunit [Myxococcaceae bacterium]
MKKLLALVLIAFSLGACSKPDEGGGGGAGGKGGGKPKGPAQFPVETAAVQTREVQYAVNAVGSLEAFEVVQVTARVQGAVEKVSFREGDSVQAGAVMVEIEPSRFQVAVNAAKAQLAKAQAEKADAQAGLERRTAVNEKNPGLIRGEELETFRTHAATAEADLSEAKAALDQAQLNLRDAYVRAPLQGVIQTRTVQTGQYVQPGAVLATIVRRDPLLLRFQVPEQDAASLKNGATANFTVRGLQQSYTAKITLVADTADPKSRLVQVTAEVNDAKKDSLRPGTFAEVAVPVGGMRAAPVIPQTAIRPSERGFLAYVVENNVAKERVVELGLRTEDGRVEVKSGLQPGDQLVVRGSEALRDNAPVKVTNGGGGAALGGSGKGDGGASGAVR